MLSTINNYGYSSPYTFHASYLKDQHGDYSTSQRASLFNSLGEDIAPILLFNLLWNFGSSRETNFKKYIEEEKQSLDFNDIAMYVNHETKKYFVSYSDSMKPYIADKPWIEEGEIVIGSKGMNFILGYNRYFFGWLNDFSQEKETLYEGTPVNFINTIDVFREMVAECADEQIKSNIYQHLNESPRFRDRSERIINKVLRDCQEFISTPDYSKLLDTNAKLISIINRDTKRFENLINPQIDLESIFKYCRENNLL